MTQNSDNRLKLFKMLNLYHFVNDGIVFLIPTLMKTFYEMFNLSYSQTSAIVGVHLFFVILGQIINGYISDKGKEKAQYLVGITLLTISTFMINLASTFWTLFFLAAFNGIGLGFIHAIIYVLGAKIYSEDRERKMARQGFYGDIGKMSAILSSGLIITLTNVSWHVPVIIWGVFALVLAIYSYITLPRLVFPEFNLDTIGEDKSSSEAIHPKSQEIEIQDQNRKRKAKILLFLFFILYTGSQEIILKFFTVFLGETRTGLSSQYAELIYALLVGSGTLGVYLSGYFKVKFGFHRFLTRIYIIILSSLVLFILFNRDALLFDIIFAMIFGFTLLSIYITIQSELSFYVEFKKLGLGYGLLLGIGWFGGFVANISAGPLADKYGAQTFFILPLILSIISFILLQTIPKRK